MSLADLSKLQGSFGYRLCALYLPQKYNSSTTSEALRMLVGGLGEEWRDKATFDDVCMELELAGVGYAGTLRSVVLAGLGESIEEEYIDAGEAAEWIAKQDQKLGVWAACACARETLKYVAIGERRPRIAIETAEAWVRGEATKEQAEKAANAAADAGADAAAAAAAAADAAADAAYAAYDAYAAAAYAAANAANAANAAADAADAAADAAYAADAAADAAYAAADAAYAADAADASANAAWAAANAAARAATRAPLSTSRDAELRRLVSVIARSLQTFTVLLTAPE